MSQQSARNFDEISEIRSQTFTNFKKLRRQMDKSYILLNKQGVLHNTGESIFIKHETSTKVIEGTA